MRMMTRLLCYEGQFGLDEENETNKKNESNPEFENFQQLLKATLSVPKEQLDKQRAK